MNSYRALYVRTKEFAQDNPAKSWWHVLSTTAYLFAALAATLPFCPLWLRLLAGPLAGLLVVRMFVIYHDQQHRAILARSRLAEVYMRTFGVLVMCPGSIWRQCHDHHHAHNSQLHGTSIGSFPIMTKEQFDSSSRWARFKYLIMRHPVVLILGYPIVFVLGMVVLPSFQNPRKHWDCVVAALVHTVGIVAMVHFWGWLALALTLFVPMTLAGLAGSYLFYIQHNFPGVTLMDKDGWTYEGAALESSSHFRPGPVLGWFTGNIGYHHIHHLNHKIPFYRLPEVYRALPELQQAKTVSLNPREVLQCLTLKVWCVRTQQMVGLRESRSVLASFLLALFTWW